MILGGITTIFGNIHIIDLLFNAGVMSETPKFKNWILDSQICVYFIISMNMEPQRGSTTKVPWSFRKSSNDSKNQFVSLIDVTAATAKIKQAIGKPNKK